MRYNAHMAFNTYNGHCTFIMVTQYVCASIGGETPTANFAVIGGETLTANQCSDAM
jgi:hypothetical protein